MDKAFDPLVKSLDSIAAAITAISPTHSETLNTTHGWNQVGLTLADLASLATMFAIDIRELGSDTVDAQGAAILAKTASQLDQFRNSAVPQFWGGNGVYAVQAYISTIQGLRDRIRHLMPKLVPIDPRSLPAQLAKRIARTTSELDSIVVDRDALAERMKSINDAYETAELLPETLASLTKAKDQMEQFTRKSFNETAAIEEKNHAADTTIAAMNLLHEQADKLVAQCEEAYRVTTSKGLAGAFDQRATTLSQSMQLWVLALVVALVAAAILGGQRVELLSKNLGESDPKWGVIWLNFALSLLSVGGPLWFAWVATKQIGQRFRLAEDYGYKASIAKAYEGYRREAAKLDPDFTARLFGSSLTRLEEPPLRLMESVSHGSPLHELLNSTKVQQAMATAPVFREKILDLMNEAQRIVRTKEGLPPKKENPNQD